MDLSTINWIAVIVSAIAFYGIGAIWYSFLFQKAWMAQVNVTKEDAKNANMAVIMTSTFIITFLMVSSLALFLSLNPAADLRTGALYGLIAGIGISSMTVAMNALYEMRNWRYIAINSGYMTVGFIVSGIILGAWK